MNINTLTSFEKLLLDKELGKIIKDFAENSIDNVISNEFIKNIPLLNSFVALIKFGNDIEKSIFTKNLFSILNEIESVSIVKRKEVFNKIDMSEKFQNKVGLIIINQISKLDIEHKPRILGKLLKAVLEEKISFKEYLHSSHLINSIFIYDLLDLVSKYNGEKVNGEISYSIAHSGIVDLYGSNLFSQEEVNAIYEAADKNGIYENQSEVSYEMTKIGKIIIEYGFLGN